MIRKLIGVLLVLAIIGFGAFWFLSAPRVFAAADLPEQITWDFAQKELGEVVFVELPQVGHVYDAGDEIGTIESVKAVAEVFTPIAGEIVEVNEALADDPELVNEDPHVDGWLVKIRFSASSDLDSLMDAEAYGEFVQQGKH